jgi:hypothetical protein
VPEYLRVLWDSFPSVPLPFPVPSRLFRVPQHPRSSAHVGIAQEHPGRSPQHRLWQGILPLGSRQHRSVGAPWRGSTLTYDPEDLRDRFYAYRATQGYHHAHTMPLPKQSITCSVLQLNPNTPLRLTSFGLRWPPFLLLDPCRR